MERRVSKFTREHPRGSQVSDVSRRRLSRGIESSLAWRRGKCLLFYNGNYAGQRVGGARLKLYKAGSCLPLVGPEECLMQGFAVSDDRPEFEVPQYLQ